MSHMGADSLDELHEMAATIGLDARWFQASRLPHYDVCQSKRSLALKHGAVEITSQELIEIIKRYKR